jgi:hypothetical protein
LKDKCKKVNQAEVEGERPGETPRRVVREEGCFDLKAELKD